MAPKAMKAMKKSMKAMKKAMKAAKKPAMKKAMKKTAMKVSVVAKGKRAKSSVFRGTKEKTSGGLKKESLMKNKQGKVVSKKSSVRAKKNMGKTIGKWHAAVMKARNALKITGFVPIGGKSAQGQALLKKCKSFYK